MGVFSRIFRRPEVEKGLEDEYVPMLLALGMSEPEAREAFRMMLQRVKEDAKRAGTLELPMNIGDIRLQQASTDEALRSLFAKKRADGVTDEDIRWWGNMHELERRMMLAVDDIIKLASAKALSEKGMSTATVAERLKKTFSSYTPDPDAKTVATGQDRPLPVELKDRVNSYVLRRSQTDRDRFEEELEQCSSFNASIRKEIIRGNL